MALAKYFHQPLSEIQAMQVWQFNEACRLMEGQIEEQKRALDNARG